MITPALLKEYYESQGRMDFNRQMYENPNPFRREFHEGRLMYVLDMTMRHAGSSKVKSLLDAGCGDGHYLWFFDGKTMDLNGIDISHSFIERAEERAPEAKLRVGFIEELPYKSNQFDIVLCSETLEHVFDYEKALDEICRVSNGDVVISVPIEKTHPFVRLGLFVLGKKDMIPSEVHADGKGFEEMKGGHLREFTPEKLDRDIRKRGFSVVKRKKVHNSALIAVFFVLSEKLPFLNRLSGVFIPLARLMDFMFPWWGLTYVVVVRKCQI